MKREIIDKLHGQFEDYIKNKDGVEFWFAREIQELLGYSQWRNFEQVINKAKISCQNANQPVENHFADVSNMVDIGSGTKREINDIALTRYACYLIAQNGDPRKNEIAFAQTYFAVQTRKQEIIEKRLSEVERIGARKKLTDSERELSGIIYERIEDERGFGRIRSRGDQALFGGNTTQDMKNRLGIPHNRPLADFLPTITIKAKDFANEITSFNIKRDNLEMEDHITHEHVKNNADVRSVLTSKGIYPEKLPPAEDLKKIERRLVSDEKKLSLGKPVKSKITRVSRRKEQSS